MLLLGVSTLATAFTIRSRLLLLLHRLLFLCCVYVPSPPTARGATEKWEFDGGRATIAGKRVNAVSEH